MIIHSKKVLLPSGSFRNAAINIKSGKTSETRFVHLSNLKLDDATSVSVSDEGRLRWKIENEGFNTQKNGGYGLEHKYSRTSFNAMKNYYQCLQIASSSKARGCII